MKLQSNAWADAGPIPERYAAGRVDATTTVAFAENVSPPLAWSGVPPGTRSSALVCHDPDVPSRPDDVNQPGREVPDDLPRLDFFHWVLVDLPAGTTRLSEGEFSRGFTPHGKGPETPHGARQGINDYTGWFAADPERRGDYHGYDGPFPPFNDARMHRYVFTLYALDVARLPLAGRFGGADVRRAVQGHLLAQAAFSGTYTLNARLQGRAS